MILSIILIILGFVALIYGANWLVDGASSFAKKKNISDLVIGFTIVAFGTSAPELVVNSVAAVGGFSDIVMGNIVGSNNFNLFITLGIASIVYPLYIQLNTIQKEIPISLFITILVLLFANNFWLSSDPTISRWEAAVLLLLFCMFLFYMFKQLKSDLPADEFIPKSNLKIFFLIVIGLAGLILGGKLVVDNAIVIATDLGVSQKVIGLTIIAAGTSLPELVTSVVAAIKKNSDIAIGNILGSNIFNILLILPLSILINPLDYNINFNTDFYILIGGTAFVLAAVLIGKTKKVTRWHGLILLSFYLGYTAYIVSNEI